MACVGTATVSHNDITLFGENIDNLAFAFVAPL
jgi:hypothetical protein